MWRGSACLEARRHKQAMLWLRLAEVLSFQKAELHYLLARCHRRFDEFDDAEVHLDRAYKLGWDANQLKREQWLTIVQRGRYEEIEPHWPILFADPGSDGPEICEAYVSAAFGQSRIDNALDVISFYMDRSQSLVADTCLVKKRVRDLV